jgi:sugar phosphate isomerase/epimerase
MVVMYVPLHFFFITEGMMILANVPDIYHVAMKENFG